MKEELLSQYEIVAMCKNSLKLKERMSGATVYIHKNVFNQLDFADAFRETNITIKDKEQTWIEIQVWKMI